MFHESFVNLEWKLQCLRIHHVLILYMGKYDCDLVWLDSGANLSCFAQCGIYLLFFITVDSSIYILL